MVFGLALSVASTVVLLRALQERRQIETERGRIAVGWLIVEDLAMVLALVLLPAVAGALGGTSGGLAGSGELFGIPLASGLWGVLGLTLVKVTAFVILMLVVGRRLIPWILHYVAHTGSRELFRLAVLAIALGVAFGAAKLFGVSLALGAFFAGMIMSESELSHRAAEKSLPLRDAFAVLFFVSVGMLFDPARLFDNTWPILATLFIIVIGKSLAAFLIVAAFRYPVGTALTISASLAQIGEFSFILADLGVGLDLLPEQARDLILAGAILSILLNPLAFALVDRLQPMFEARAAKSRAGPKTEGLAASPSAVSAESDASSAPPQTMLKEHTILVGYGRVGSLIGQSLKQAALPFVVIEDADNAVSKLLLEGIETIAGNAARAEILDTANPAAARRLILAIPNAFEAGQITMRARVANPTLSIIARAHSDAEVDHLESLGANVVIMGEREIARGIVDEVLKETATEASKPASAEPTAAGEKVAQSSSQDEQRRQDAESAPPAGESDGPPTD